MPVTYPRNFPRTFFQRSLFDLQRSLNTATSGSGARQVMERFDPLWYAEWTVANLSREEYGEWHAWILSLRGGAKPFWGFDPHRRFPQAYPTNFLSVMPGNGTLVSASGTSIVFNGCPAGLVLSIGDYVSVVTTGGLRSLHKLVEPAVANGSGQATVEVEPRVVMPVSAGAVVRLADASCLFRLIEVTGLERTNAATGFRFTAIESLNLS